VDTPTDAVRNTSLPGDDVEGRVEGSEDPHGQRLHVELAVLALAHEHELVAAPPRQGVVRSAQPVEALGDQPRSWSPTSRPKRSFFSLNRSRLTKRRATGAGLSGDRRSARSRRSRKIDGGAAP
jgi:hypothetical protein